MFTTYAASAGSGKTFSLVIEYLTICFKNLIGTTQSNEQTLRKDFRSILAMTFTVNAASEMKTRILDVLRTMAFATPGVPFDPYEEYYAKLAERLFAEQQLLTDEEKRKRIRETALLQLQHILYDYDSFSVTTLDSFFQRIIRSSALRMGLHLNYSVEIELDEFFHQVVEQVVDNLRKNDPFSQRVLKMLNNELEDTGKSNVIAQLTDTLSLLYKNTEENYEFLKSLELLDKNDFEKQIAHWRTFVFQTIPAELESTIAQHAKQILKALCDDRGILKENVSKNVYNWVEKLANDPSILLLHNKEKRKSNQTNIQKLHEERYMNKGGVMDGPSTNIIAESIAKIIEWQQTSLKKYHDGRLLLKTAEKLLIIFDVQHLMEEVKSTQTLFFLAESNIKIHEELMKSGTDTPPIYEKLGFNHFFVDEFQDTSRMQWDNLKPLIQNNAIDQNGSAILFGDVKQAIYRWRGGDSRILFDLSDFNRQLNSPFGFRTLDQAHFNTVPLDVNYRSLEKVVTFNNAFFKKYADNLSLGEYYKEVEQKVKHKEPGLVQVFLHEKPAKDDKTDAPRPFRGSLPESHQGLDAYILDNYPELAPSEYELLYAVRDAIARGYSCSDILILYRSNANCEATAALLMAAGIPVETKNSLLLHSAPEVQLIIKTLQLLLNPKDLSAQAAILMALTQLPNAIIPADTKTSIPKRFIQLDNKEADTFQSIISEIFGKRIPFDKWQHEPLYILIQNIIRLYHLERLESPFVNDFNDYVASYLNNRKGDVAAFLERWQFLIDNDKMITVQSLAKQNAIRIMTVHNSKGLQYPVVIYHTSEPKEKETSFWTKDLTDTNATRPRVAFLSGMGSEFENSSFEKSFDEENKIRINDELNIAYVAHTRAEELLYLISPLIKDVDTNQNKYPLFVQQFAMNAKSADGAPLFQTADSKKRVFWLGDMDWCKIDKSQSKTQTRVVNPPMVVSDFGSSNMMAPAGMSEEDPRAIGTRVHNYLSGIVVFPQNLDELEQMLSEAPTEMRPYLRNFFQQILNDDEMRPFFGPEATVYNEISILCPDGNVKRPDRVSILNGNVRVYDYKTGHEDEQYKQQIEEYCQLIHSMGYENVQGRLIYWDAS